MAKKTLSVLFIQRG